MTELRTTIYGIDESVEKVDEKEDKKGYCSLGMAKCLGSIIFLSLMTGVSYLISVKYKNHLEDNSGSL